MRPRHPQAGFTLIEMIVTLLLTAIIMTALVSMTSQWMRLWSRNAERMGHVASVSTSLDRLSDDLRTALSAIVMPAFIGDENALVFVRVGSDPLIAGALERVELRIQDQDIIRMSAPFRGDSLKEATQSNSAPLHFSPFTLRFSYLGEQDQVFARWEGLRPPSAIRLQLKSPAGDETMFVIRTSVDVPAYCARVKTYADCGITAFDNGAGGSR